MITCHFVRALTLRRTDRDQVGVVSGPGVIEVTCKELGRLDFPGHPPSFPRDQLRM